MENSATFKYPAVNDNIWAIQTLGQYFNLQIRGKATYFLICLIPLVVAQRTTCDIHDISLNRERRTIIKKSHNLNEHSCDVRMGVDDSRNVLVTVNIAEGVVARTNWIRVVKQ